MKTIEKERIAYYVLVFSLAVSVFGFSYSRYIVYTAPLLLLFVWLTTPSPRLFYNSYLTPFYIVVVIAIVTSYAYGFQGFKRVIFLGVYVTVFTLFDFSQIRIDIAKLGALLAGIFIAQTTLFGSADGRLEYSLINSKSTFETTLAFSFGVISCYFALSGKYRTAFLFAVLALVGLKRIAVIGLLVITLLLLLPRRVSSVLINPLLVTAASIGFLAFSILFAYGVFDRFIFDAVGLSANHFTQGRQDIWLKLLENAEYEFSRFLFSGLGSGGSVSTLYGAYGQEVLAHNDILVLYMDFGLIATLFFLFTLAKQKLFVSSLMAIYLLILFLTDNVIVYQHIMVVYLLCQAQLKRQAEELSSSEQGECHRV
jgi:hypothetical protein